ncbi:hypothetical protein AB0E69_05475 [Kribbella sp. NPDC026611]|uniref:hypothetical protein n=1 Tax=Kribbella sp. NPDC026611 TaxID=3154911 RepID=UPI0033D9E6D9
MTTPLDPYHPLVPWTQTIVDAVRDKVRRHIRWRGVEVVVLPDDHPGVDRVSALRAANGPVALPQLLADVVRDARTRADELHPFWDNKLLVEATGVVMSQAAALSSPEVAPVGDLPQPTPGADAARRQRAGDSGLFLPEAELDIGLGDVWTQQHLPELWPKLESAWLAGTEDRPDLTFAGRDPAAAKATRALLTEIVRQQGDGKPVEAEDYAALSDSLLSTTPGWRWDEIVSLLPGTDELSETDRWRSPDTLRVGFHDAVQNHNPRLATDAVRAVAERADPLLRRLVDDPAIGRPRLVAGGGDAGRGAVWSSTFRHGRGQQER